MSDELEEDLKEELAEELAQALPEGMVDNPFGKPDSCRACPLFNAPGVVWGSGPENAQTMSVGEAPGETEVDTPHFRPDRMKPFIGGAGRLRNALRAHAGVPRGSDFVTNVVKCRPPGNRTPTPDEIASCLPFLLAEIREVKPNVVVALGEVALGALTGKKGIGNYRGVPTESLWKTDDPQGRGTKIFPTWHPSFIIHSQHLWAFAVHDLVRSHAESLFPEIRRIPIEIIRPASVSPSRDDLLRSIRERHAATFDFETTGLSPRSDSILMCGFVGRPDQAHVYDWTIGTQQLFDEILGDPSVEVCGQNILNFDLPFAEEKGHPISRERWTKGIFDTMVVFHLCNSSYGQTSIAMQNRGRWQGARGAEKDLAFIASCHTDMEYWKSRSSYKEDLKEVCGKDVIGTDRSAYDPRSGLKEELRSLDMLDLYYKRVLPVHLPLHRMTQRGVRIDEELAMRKSIELELHADMLEEELKIALNDPLLDLNSPKQMMTLLYDRLGLPEQTLKDKKTGEYRRTANADAIEALVSMFPQHAILESIVTIRHMRKMKSTYVDPAARDGRLHPRFGVSKAANGRFNSQDPNAQNVPEDMRDIWVADDEDCILISADSSQIEWRNAMVLSGDPVGLELLRSGHDNHRGIAAETLGRPIESISDAERHAAKFIIYGLAYGRGAASIAEANGYDLNWTIDFVTRFFSRFRVFAEWREELLRFVRTHHFLVNPYKRRRWWYGLHLETTEIFNYPASSCAADQMIDEIILLEKQLPEGATLRLTVHDEVVINCPKDIVKEAIECIRTIMQKPCPEIVDASAYPATVKRFYPEGFFVPVDIGVGTNWAMCKAKGSPELKAQRAALEKNLGLKS